LPASIYEAYARQLSAFRKTDPFRFRPLAGSLFQTALRQIERHGGSPAEPSIDFTSRRWKTWDCNVS
jgi:hypothetical protein